MIIIAIFLEDILMNLMMTINGKLIAGKAKNFAVINPATEQPMTECPAAS